MSKLVFTPRMFGYGIYQEGEHMGPAFACGVAQEIHDKWLEENGQVLFFEDDFGCISGRRKQSDIHTHQALLINVEPLTVTEKCEHDIENIWSIGLVCLKCGTKFKSK